MDKTDYNYKTDSLVTDKQTYEVLKRDPTPALQRKLNNKLLTLKKTDKIDFRRYNRLRCSVPQPPKHYTNADIQSTKEIEENGKIPFLHCLVTLDNHKLKTTIYRRPTHTDQLLDQSSYNPTSHKATTIQTLTRRAQLVCDSLDSLQDETDYLNNVFSKNNNNTDFVRRNTQSNTDSNT
ncbi:unnamed protein product [Porites evermanni]|uniref:Helix-turn-helix domain-containing protein n=1 Tax=Porites evermanni TaxID=104178 RepID=A0ABN8LJY0_9CNID|nr:unnamed protein product [Porites evermanni]